MDSIHIRFLERAKPIILDLSRQELDKEAIEHGNAAAHGGNGKADAALHNLRLYATEGSEEIYKALHYNAPSDFTLDWSPKICNAIDCWATIRSANSGFGSVFQRAQGTNFQEIFDDADTMSYEAFERRSGVLRGVWLK